MACEGSGGTAEPVEVPERMSWPCLRSPGTGWLFPAELSPERAGPLPRLRGCAQTVLRGDAGPHGLLHERGVTLRCSFTVSPPGTASLPLGTWP